MIKPHEQLLYQTLSTTGSFGSSINLPNRSSINNRPDESVVSGYAEAGGKAAAIAGRA